MPERPNTRKIIVLTVLATIAAVFVISKLASRSPSPYTTFPMKSTSGIARDMGAVGMMEPSFAPSESDAMMGISPMPPIYQPESGASAEDRKRLGPKIIHTGTLTLRVDDTEKRLEEAKQLAKEFDGFVADVNLHDRAGVRTANLTVRVPSKRFDDLVLAAKKLAVVVLAETSNAEDVTEAFVDLEARLKAARAEEAQYLQILKQARNVEETLQVTQVLGEVRSRIEQMEGQLRYLSDRTDYATLSLVLTEETKIEVPTRTWKPLETIRQSFRGLILTLQSAADFVIVLVVFGIGLILPGLLVLWGLYRLVRRFMNKNKG